MRAPILWCEECIGEEERAVIRNLGVQLLHLDLLVTQFESAVSLIEFCGAQIYEAQRVVDAATTTVTDSQTPGMQEIFALFDTQTHFGGWKAIAGRDAAMTLDHFRETIQIVGESFAKCPTLSAKIDHKQIKAARQIFRGFFPDAEFTRDTVGHPARWIRSPEQSEANATVGPINKPGLTIEKGATAYIGQAVLGDEFAFSRDGRMTGLLVNQQTLGKLVRVQELFYGAFTAVDGIPLKSEQAPPPDHAG